MATIRKNKPAPKLLPIILPNAGIAAAYARDLNAFINEMTNSYRYWLSAEYKKKPPVIAQDTRSNYDMFTEKLKEIGENWIKKFEDWAPIIAEEYTKKMFGHTNNAFNNALRQSGWQVDLKWTPSMRQAFDVALKTNVALIKSIPVQFHSSVEFAVAKSFEKGMDVGGLQKELEKIYPNGRAKLIARDQSLKANSAVTNTRAIDAGIKEGLWKHSPSAREPRIDHKAAHNKRYNLAEGCLISGEYIQPGEKINCKCVVRVILPGYGE